LVPVSWVIDLRDDTEGRMALAKTATERVASVLDGLPEVTARIAARAAASDQGGVVGAAQELYR
jgi:hypothetical protein